MWWCKGLGVGLAIQRSRVRPPVRAPLGKLFTPLCSYQQAIWFGTGQLVVTLCCWESNRRFHVAVTMRDRLHL